MSAEALETALASAAAALSRHDALAAEGAVADAVAACASLDAAGASLAADARRRIAALHAEVLATATRLRDALAAEVESAGRSRRATRAYGAR